jgi:hypothetical protein
MANKGNNNVRLKLIGLDWKPKIGDSKEELGNFDPADSLSYRHITTLFETCHAEQLQCFRATSRGIW